MGRRGLCASRPSHSSPGPAPVAFLPGRQLERPGDAAGPGLEHGRGGLRIRLPGAQLAQSRAGQDDVERHRMLEPRLEVEVVDGAADRAVQPVADRAAGEVLAEADVRPGAGQGRGQVIALG